MHGRDICSQFAHDALEIIENDMLKMAKPSERLSSRDLLAKFKGLRIKCEKMLSYTTVGKRLERASLERPHFYVELEDPIGASSLMGGAQKEPPLLSPPPTSGGAISSEVPEILIEGAD